MYVLEGNRLWEARAKAGRPVGGRQWAQTKIVAVEVVRSGQILCKVGSKGLPDRLDVGYEKKKEEVQKDSKSFGLTSWDNELAVYDLGRS